MHATIGTDGKVENLSVVSGNHLLRKAAMDAVRQWQYQPTLVDGKPIEVELNVSVTFALDEKPSQGQTSSPQESSRPQPPPPAPSQVASQPTAPTESQPQEQTQNQAIPPAATATTDQAGQDVHILIAQFVEQLRKTGGKEIVVIGGPWPPRGQKALQDWLVAQVSDVLSHVPVATGGVAIHEPNAFDLVQASREESNDGYGRIVLPTDGVDAVVSASVCLGKDGLQITLNAVHAKTEKGQDSSMVLVSQAIPVTDETAALLPADWKQQMEEDRNGAPKAPMADKDSVPRCISCKDPSYTELARQFKVMGMILVTLTVEKNGTASGIRLVKGVGFGLDEAAVERISQWSFGPALDKEGNPTATMVTVEVAFRIS